MPATLNFNIPPRAPDATAHGFTIAPGANGDCGAFRPPFPGWWLIRATFGNSAGEANLGGLGSETPTFWQEPGAQAMPIDFIGLAHYTQADINTGQAVIGRNINAAGAGVVYNCDFCAWWLGA